MEWVRMLARENLINGILPKIAHREGTGRLSSYGWGLRYFGGLLNIVKVKRDKRAARQPDIEDRAVS